MTIQHNITLDLVQPGLTPRLYAMQHDANSRVIVFTLTQAGQPWEAPAGAIFGLSYRKSDGTRGYYTENITRTGVQICVTVAPQVLTCPGTVDAALVCNAADGSRIAAFPLQIQVRPDPAAGKEDSDDYFNPADAVRYTPQTLTDAQKQQARANLGLEAAADTWRYNGYQLPPLPDWDKATYPYAVISLRESIGLYYLSVHKAIRYFEGIPLLGSDDRNTNFGDSTPGTALLYTWQEGMAAWELFDKDNWSISVERDDTGKDIALWANFDLLDDAGELYVGASDPVHSEGGVDWSPVVIDLDTYGGGTFETSVTAALLQLLNNGGGEQSNVPMGNLFSDLNTERPIKIQFSMPTDEGGMVRITIDGVTTVRIGGQVREFYLSAQHAGPGVVASTLAYIAANGTIMVNLIVPGA